MAKAGPTAKNVKVNAATILNRSYESTSFTSCIRPPKLVMLSCTLLRAASRQSLRASRTMAPRAAFFSSDSHDDFAPKRKTIDDEDSALNAIKEHVESNSVMLYMKGKPSMPMCGFSARVVGILQEQGIDFSSVNVLDYPTIREGVKKYSDWPTIPQLYVNGEFIGGCDIVTSMNESGELAELLKEAKKSASE